MCGSAECSGDMYAGAPQITDSGTAGIDGAARVKATATELTDLPRIVGHCRRRSGRFPAVAENTLAAWP